MFQRKSTELSVLILLLLKWYKMIVVFVQDLYGQAVEASIIDMYDYGSPDTMNSSLSNTTLYR
jgi:hypothetical protein